jgi:hypothetical protein
MSEPTHEQAQLLLQIYDLRREQRLRTARAWFMQNFWAETMEEIEQVAPQGSDQNAYMRQVASYWDMACMLMNQGLLHREQFFNNNGEAYMVWNRFKPLVGTFRQMYKNPAFFREMELAAAEYEKHSEQTAPGYLEVMQGFIQQAREAAKAARKPKKTAKKKARKKAARKAKKKSKKKAGKKKKR